MKKGILAVATGLLLGMLMLSGCGKAVKTEEKKEVFEKFQFLNKTGEVQEYGDSMFSVEYFNAGTGITYMAQDVSTEARKNADGQVEFSADFSVKLSGQNEKGDVGEEIAGPYHGEALGEGEKK